MVLFSFILLDGCANLNKEKFVIEEKSKSEINKEKVEESIEIDSDVKNIDSGDNKINKLIYNVVKITDEEKVEYTQWVEKDHIYRVAIERVNEDPVEYLHLRDYFFIDNAEEPQYFEVTYPSKLNKKADRYVYDACGFEVDYIDINFDDNKDIVISLGHQGSNADMVNCAYVYENGEYVYKKSFEQIVNYSVDNSDKLIIGTYSAGPYEHVEIKYAYRDGKFVEVSEDVIEN